MIGTIYYIACGIIELAIGAWLVTCCYMLLIGPFIKDHRSELRKWDE